MIKLASVIRPFNLVPYLSFHQLHSHCPPLSYTGPLMHLQYSEQAPRLELMYLLFMLRISLLPLPKCLHGSFLHCLQFYSNFTFSEIFLTISQQSHAFLCFIVLPNTCNLIISKYFASLLIFFLLLLQYDIMKIVIFLFCLTCKST